MVRRFLFLIFTILFFTELLDPTTNFIRNISPQSKETQFQSLSSKTAIFNIFNILEKDKKENENNKNQQGHTSAFDNVSVCYSTLVAEFQLIIPYLSLSPLVDRINKLHSLFNGEILTPPQI